MESKEGIEVDSVNSTFVSFNVVISISLSVAWEHSEFSLQCFKISLEFDLSLDNSNKSVFYISVKSFISFHGMGIFISVGNSVSELVVFAWEDDMFEFFSVKKTIAISIKEIDKYLGFSFLNVSDSVIG